MTDTTMRRDFEAWAITVLGCKPTGHFAWEAWQAATERATAIERERCAMVCETKQVARNTKGAHSLVHWHVDTPGIHEGMTYAAAIRQGGAE